MATEEASVAYLRAPLTMGELLKRARDHTGLRQEAVKVALAERGVDVSISDISRWENNVRRPGAIQVMSLADLYGVKPVDLGATLGELAQIDKVKEIASRVLLHGERSRPSVIPGSGDRGRKTYVDSPLLRAARA